MKIIYEIMEPVERSMERLSLLRTHIDCIKISQGFLYERSLSYIREIKDAYPEKCVIADTRILTDDISIAERAAENGADMVSVSYSADIDTLTHVISSMKERGVGTVVDVIGVEPRFFPEVEKKLKGLHPYMVCFYFEGSLYRDEPGIFARKDAIEKLGRLQLGTETCVSGSITTEYMEEIRNAGVAAADLGNILNRNIHAENIALRFGEI